MHSHDIAIRFTAILLFKHTPFYCKNEKSHAGNADMAFSEYNLFSRKS